MAAGPVLLVRKIRMGIQDSDQQTDQDAAGAEDWGREQNHQDYLFLWSRSVIPVSLLCRHEIQALRVSSHDVGI